MFLSGVTYPELDRRKRDSRRTMVGGSGSGFHWGSCFDWRDKGVAKVYVTYDFWSAKVVSGGRGWAMSMVREVMRLSETPYSLLSWRTYNMELYNKNDYKEKNTCSSQSVILSSIRRSNSLRIRSLYRSGGGYFRVPSLNISEYKDSWKSESLKKSSPG